MTGSSAGSSGGPIQPDDLEVTLAVRRDLGAEQDQAVIGEFLDRVGAAIDQRVDARVNAHRVGPHPPQPQPDPPIALGIVSIVCGIFVTAMVTGPPSVGSTGGFILSGIIWVAIAVVNLAYTRRR